MLNGAVEKRPPVAFSALCRAHVLRARSVRQIACGLAGRAFLNSSAGRGNQ